MELFDEEKNSRRDDDCGKLDELLERLGDVSPNARDDAVYAMLFGFSEHSPASPPMAAILRFVRKVLAAANLAAAGSSEERAAAERASIDRLDPDTEQVKFAAWKVAREFDRLRGLLRFKPEGAEPRYTARCAPDHFVLPLLADHFRERFGETAWAIIDEKRKLVLSSKNGAEPVLRKMAPEEHGRGTWRENASDEWEGLWKNYHRSINNEARPNPGLQKQFLPCRYWKYLTEFN